MDAQHMRSTPSLLRMAGIALLLGATGPLTGHGDLEATAPDDVAHCASPPKVVGPDGIPGTADDGWVVEDFDTERDGSPGISLSNLPRGTPGILNDTIGVWVGTGTGGPNLLGGVACGGFDVPPVDPSCRIDPDNDMDWHIHCPQGTCPNASGLITPTGGEFAFSGLNSLHWGRHLDPGSRGGDTTRFRQLAAFMTDPLNLTPAPEPGDLELSFFHVADMMDNNSYNPPTGQANDFGDVQIQVFDPGAPGGGEWGFWDRLAPFQNVYDHVALVWSSFGGAGNYCVFTPNDTGAGGYAPRGVKETLCHPNGIWSHCGNAYDTTTTYQCAGPGVTGNTGTGLWVQSRFSLADYAGRTVRIRWIAQSWEFDCCSESYDQLGGAWSAMQSEDGWWIDDIKITGVVQYASPPVSDEVCNGVDDDCDGSIDEDLGQTTCGMGACIRIVDNCSGGLPQTCVPGAPSEEICDGVDNDCDGVVDDGIGPGTVSVELEPPQIWPPNHRMVGIHATVTLSGGCPSACPTPPSVTLTSARSDEPDDADGNGDGQTVDDVQGAAVGSADFDLEVRAERDAGGPGRHYEVTYAVTDCFGVTSVGSSSILVPHEREGTAEPVVMSATETSAGTRLAWEAVPGAMAYQVVRGNAAGLRDAGQFIDLGPVVCLQAGSTATTTVGNEDADDPPPGQVFFYLLSYSDASGDSGYGTATATKPRIAASGDCR